MASGVFRLGCYCLCLDSLYNTMLVVDFTLDITLLSDFITECMYLDCHIGHVCSLMFLWSKPKSPMSDLYHSVTVKLENFTYVCEYFCFLLQHGKHLW